MYVKIKEVSKHKATHELVDGKYVEICKDWEDVCPYEKGTVLQANGYVFEDRRTNCTYSYTYGGFFATEEDAEAQRTKNQALALIRHHAEATQECMGRHVTHAKQFFIGYTYDTDDLYIDSYTTPRESLLDVWYDSLESAQQAINYPNIAQAYRDWANA